MKEELPGQHIFVDKVSQAGMVISNIYACIHTCVYIYIYIYEGRAPRRLPSGRRRPDIHSKAGRPERKDLKKYNNEKEKEKNKLRKERKAISTNV